VPARSTLAHHCQTSDKWALEHKREATALKSTCERLEKESQRFREIAEQARHGPKTQAHYAWLYVSTPILTALVLILSLASACFSPRPPFPVHSPHSVRSQSSTR
jgi:hypothetical protein